MVGISRRPSLFVVGAFCADIIATSNKTAAMYFMNDDPSHRERRPAFSLIEFAHGTGDRPSYGGPAKHDFGYLQSILLKDENQLWAPMCKLTKETTECFAA